MEVYWWTVRLRSETDFIAATISVGMLGREYLDVVHRLVCVAYEVEEPSQRDGFSFGIAVALCNAFVFRQSSEKIDRFWWPLFHAFGLAVWSERIIEVVPRCTMLWPIFCTDVVGPTRCKHKQHLVGVDKVLFKLRFPAGFIPGVLLQDRFDGFDSLFTVAAKDLVG